MTELSTNNNYLNVINKDKYITETKLVEKVKKPKVAVLCCSLDTVSMVWMERSWNPLWYKYQPDFDKSCQVMRGSTSVAQKRNRMIDRILEDPAVTHVFMLDNDVLYEDNGGDINIVIRMMMAMNLDICAGMMRVRGNNNLGGVDFPCMAYAYNEEQEGWTPLDYKLFKKKDALTRVDGIGNGFTMIKREVFDKISKPYFFEDKFTEDFYFDLKARDAGYKIYVINDIHLSHISLLKIKWDGTISEIDQMG